MARDALVRLEIVLLLALTAGPIDGEDANPKQQRENVHERGSPAQIVLPGSFSVTNQNDNAGDRAPRQDIGRSKTKRCALPIGSWAPVRLKRRKA